MRWRLAVIPIVLVLASAVASAAVKLEPLEPFPDERAAMTAWERENTPTNRVLLAKIRFTHAGELMDRYVKSRDPGTLFWALDYAQSATELDPGKASYWYLAGYLYGVAPRHAEMDRRAEAALKQAIAINPGFAEAQALLGLFYVRNKRHKEALNPLEKAALRLTEPPDPAVLSALCQAYVFGKDVQRGDEFLKDLIEKNAQNGLVKIALATLWWQSGSPDKAKALLGAVASDPKGREENRAVARLLLKDL